MLRLQIFLVHLERGLVSLNTNENLLVWWNKFTYHNNMTSSSNWIDKIKTPLWKKYFTEQTNTKSSVSLSLKINSIGIHTSWWPVISKVRVKSISLLESVSWSSVIYRFYSRISDRLRFSLFSFEYSSYKAFHMGLLNQACKGHLGRWWCVCNCDFAFSAEVVYHKSVKMIYWIEFYILAWHM